MPSKPRPRPDSDDGEDAGPERIRERAIRLLARREHSVVELRHKLTERGFEPRQVAEVVDELGREGLQSDARFTESFVRNRIERGYGPVRIRAELQERGVEKGSIEPEGEPVDWCALADAVRRKRFGPRAPTDWKERARQARFLQRRGFAHDHIRAAFDAAHAD